MRVPVKTVASGGHEAIVAYEYKYLLLGKSDHGSTRINTDSCL